LIKTEEALDKEAFDFLKLSQEGKTALEHQLERSTRIGGLHHMSFLVANYCGGLRFHFMYRFNRNELKMGKGFRRFFIQPPQISSLINIPWMAVDCLDSLVMRVFYRGFCPECQWKYNSLFGLKGHQISECAYNQEYSRIIKDIISGRIAVNEHLYRKTSEQYTRSFRRSAYLDLCCRDDTYSKILDFGSIFLSACLLIGLLVWAVFPLTMQFVQGLNEPY
jgi:hypothetical protein